jgi:O-antigen biosynthesis protein
MGNNISIFTPTHNPRYLRQLYDSIKNQGFYEWVILAQGCEIPKFNDNRVKVYNTPKLGDHYVGALKLQCCKHCTGDILMEVDHDDLLVSTAIEECKKAFEDSEVGFVYSDTANFRNEFEKTGRYNPAHGWVYESFHFEIIDGSIVDKTQIIKDQYLKGESVDKKYKELECHLGFDASPSGVSYIWYTPNHFRAWRKEVYWKTGGHNPNMRVLDDQELIMRTYLITKFKRIPKCLYLYRYQTDGNNTWLKNNQEIQEGTVRLHDEYIERLAIKWAKDNKLRCLDLGGRFEKDDRYESVDLKDANINCDLNLRWPFQNDSIGAIRSNDVFEHLRDPLFTMKELYRVLAPGGYALIKVPSTDGRGAFQDPTHFSFWNENSFLYYTNKLWGKYIDSPVKFQDIRLYTTTMNNTKVCWVVAHLLKLDDRIKRPPGIINI